MMGEANPTVLMAISGTQLSDITPLVKSIEWSGDVMQASRKLDLTLVNTLNGQTQAAKIEVGKEVRFLNDNNELFRGIIFNTEINHLGEMTASAYDDATYLTRNSDTIIFRKKKASEIFRTICTKYGIAVGTVNDTGYVIPKHIFRAMSLWDMLVTALTTTRKQNGRKFIVTAIDGKLNLLERKSRVTKVVLEDGVNITSATYAQSIEDLRNQVKVVANEDDEKKKPITATEKNQPSITKYGLMQHYESVSGDVTASQVKQLAKQLLKQLNVVNDEATLECLGIDSVVAGSSIYAKQTMTGIQGGFYVLTDTHTYENGQHTMSVKLSATDELPTMEYSE